MQQPRLFFDGRCKRTIEFYKKMPAVRCTLIIDRLRKTRTLHCASHIVRDAL